MKSSHLKTLIKTNPPHWGTGIVVKNISGNYREALVQMKMRWYNRSYINTHFGGSLFSMTDPFFMLMLMHIFGKEYFVMDKSAHIEFINPGRGTVTAEFKINDKQVEDIIMNTQSGMKYFPEFSVEIKDENHETAATVRKTLYIRKRI